MADILGDSSSPSDTESNGSQHQFTINEHFAKAYAYKKEREELQKLKDKYGSDAELEEDEDDSDSETEDEDGEELTPAVDAAILRTLSKIRKRDPVIYDSSKGVFQEESQKTSASTPWGYKARKEKDKSKPLTIKQQAMESLLDDARSEELPAPTRPTHAEEQEALRAETISAFHTIVAGDAEVEDRDEDNDDIGGGLLTLREKTKDELEREEEEYRAYLEREVGDVRELVLESTIGNPEEENEPHKAGPDVPLSSKEEKKRRKKKDMKGKSKETDQEFLMNYILNRGWIDRESRHLPTYSEITATRSRQSKTGSLHKNDDADGESINGGEDGVPDVDELEEFDDVADVFESTYNFRFEEPGAATIQRHPRNIDSTVRREDTVRKDARARKKARKEEEKAKKSEEVKRLKALKMREIRQKLDRVGKESGLSLGEDELRDFDLEGDWDPEKHDAQMTALYEDGEHEEEDLDQKPVWDDDIDISDIIPEERKSKKQKKKEERRKAKAAETQADVGVDEDAMDADFAGENGQPSHFDDEEEWDGSEEMRKRKIAEYMDEVYGLEFNDIIGGDLATRFKYAPVEKTSYSLTPAEILLASDAELNQYMGIKKYAPYRKGKERWDGQKAERLKEFKEKVAARSWGGAWQAGEGNGGASDAPKKKRKGKKERERNKMATGGGAGTAEEAPSVVEPAVLGSKRTLDADGTEESGASRRKKRRKKAVHSTADA